MPIKAKFKIIKLKSDMLQSKVELEIFEKEHFWQKWKHVDPLNKKITAICTGWNCWTGFEWHINDFRRLNGVVEQDLNTFCSKELRKRK